MLRARLFGPLSLEVDGRPVAEIQGLKPRSVLAWLLLHPGRHARSHVAARFWPDVLDTSARASLRSALWMIRSVLEPVGGSEYVVSDRDRVGVSESLPRDVDVETFGSLSASGAPEDLARALELARAPLLTDLADDWLLEARDDYAERAAGVALRLAEQAEGAGDPSAAAFWTRRALVHTRLSEATHRLLVRRLAAAGEVAEAVDAYRRLEARLVREFGAAPSAETRALVAELRAGETPRAAPAPIPPSRLGSGEPPLVGRERELAALASAWEAAERGEGGVVLLSGSAGIGKSRLARELARLAVGRGAYLASGAAFGLEGAPPFSLWPEALEAVVGDASPPRDATWPLELARLSPALESRWDRRATAAAADPELARTRLFESAVEAIRWKAARQPLLLLLDDLHLADTASVALLRHVGARLTGARVLLVATHRVASGDTLQATLDVLVARGPVLAQVSLEPLGREEIEAIVATTVPSLTPDQRAEAVSAADGNPLLAREGARAAATGREPAHGLRAWVRAPRAALPSAARVLVDVVACARRPLGLGEAAELLGGERLADAASDAVAAHLLEAEEAGVRFGHELVRDACYAEIEPARRARLHARLADVLSRRPRPAVAEVARHRRLAHDEEGARSYLAVAAEKARALGALDDAAGFLREAASGAPDVMAAELWLSLADVEAWRGNRNAHDAAFERAIRLIEVCDEPARLAEAYTARGRLLRTTLCYPHEALAAYRRAAETIEVRGVDAPELRALALAGCAWGEAAVGDVELAEELIAAVEAMPEVEADAALAAEVRLDRAIAPMHAGRLEESETLCHEAATLAQGAERPDIARVALNMAASLAAARGDFRRALAYANRAIEAGRAGFRLEGESLAARAYALSRLGRHREAASAARVQTALAARSADIGEQAVAAFDAGSLALAAGDAVSAVQHLAAALEPETARIPRALARLRLAEARLDAGETERAAQEVDRVVFEPVGPADMPETLVPRLERVEALVAAGRGHRGVARQRMAEAIAGWRRILDRGGVTGPFAATLVDIGRAPVAGLVEPSVELGRALAEQAWLLAETGDGAQARAAAAEASSLAEELAFDGYRATLERARSAAEEASNAGI